MDTLEPMGSCNRVRALSYTPFLRITPSDGVVKNTAGAGLRLVRPRGGRGDRRPGGPGFRVERLTPRVRWG